jgi:hypothetical protein
MGEGMSDEYIPTARPFNTPFEAGLRALFILQAISPTRADLQRLVFYDYLLVHSGDPGGGPPSIHAAVPHRSGEWMVKRQLIAAGLDLMFAKELIEKTFGLAGILYGASELTAPFLGYLQSDYAETVRVSASWLAERFGALSDADLASYMVANLGHWGAAFYLRSQATEGAR